MIKLGMIRYCISLIVIFFSEGLTGEFTEDGLFDDQVKDIFRIETYYGIGASGFSGGIWLEGLGFAIKF